MKKTIFTLILLFFVSCRMVSNVLIGSEIDDCPIKLNDSVFDYSVSDDYNNPIVARVIEYEKFVSSAIIKEINILLDAIKSKNIPDASFAQINTKVMNTFVTEIENSDKIGNYLSGLGGKDAELGEFIRIKVIADLKDGKNVYTKYYQSILKGVLPSGLQIADEKTFFCNSDKAQLMGKSTLVGLLHALYVTLHSVNDSIENVTLDNESFKDTAYTVKTIPLPRKFVVSDIYLMVQNSIYLKPGKNPSNNNILILDTAFHDIYNYTRYNEEVPDNIKYTPMYSVIFNINPNITSEMILSFHRIKFNEDYIPAYVVNNLKHYNDFLKLFEPVKIKNPKKEIKTGGLVLVKHYVPNTFNKNNIILGHNYSVGMVMDYDPAKKVMLALVNRDNGTSKRGIGYDVIKIDFSSITVQNEYMLYNPKDNALSTKLFTNAKTQTLDIDEDEIAQEAEKAQVIEGVAKEDVAEG